MPVLVRFSYGVLLTFCATMLSLGALPQKSAKVAPPTPEEARQGATRAAEAMEEVYDHVRIATRETAYKPSSRETLFVNECEYLVDGANFVAKVDVIDTAETNVKAGFSYALGGSAAKYFGVSRSNKSLDYSLSAFGSKPPEHFRLIAQDKARPAFAPYCIFGMRLQDLLRDPGLKIISVTEKSFQGRDVVDVLTDYSFPGSETEPPELVRYRLFFEPTTWVLQGFVIYRNPQDQGAPFSPQWITYEPNTNPPRIKRLESWSESPSQPGKKVGGKVWEITALEFGEIDPAEFSVSAFGLEEPAAGLPLSKSKFEFLYGSLSGIIFALVGVVLAAVAIKYRRSSRAGG